MNSDKVNHKAECPVPKLVKTFLDSYQGTDDLTGIIHAFYKNLYG